MLMKAFFHKETEKEMFRMLSAFTIISYFRQLYFIEGRQGKPKLEFEASVNQKFCGIPQL
jgi:hypothetical protein